MCIKPLLNLMGIRRAKVVPLELADEDIQYLVKKTGFMSREIRFWFDRFREDCPDGRLTKLRFIKMFSSFFSNPSKATALCEHIFRTFDTDGSGAIDFNEFLITVGLISSHNTLERYKWAYQLYDIDGDGSVTIDELTKVVLSICQLHADISQLPVDQIEKRVRSVFKKVDGAPEGTVDDVVTCAEFIQACIIDPDLAALLTFKADDD